MQRRCYDKKDKGYKNYGARGIQVCDRWLNSFTDFLADMGMKPNTKLSIERVDNDGHYEKSNCIWGTRKQQNNNRRNTRRLEYKGENLTVTEWSIKTGLKYETILVRIKAGWNSHDILTKPSRNRNRI